MKLTLFWVPRILTILFILFISLFALDSFEGDKSIIEKLGGFIIHLIPTIVLTILLYFAWRHELIGAIAFLILAALYLIIAWGKFPFATYLIISGPLVIIGVLFLLGWRNKVKVNQV